MRALLAVCLAVGAIASAQAAERVVTLGGSVTEIVYALGQQARLAGADQSSLYPEAATRLPSVGYYRAVPIEGVLALAPDLVLASEQAGPPEAIARIQALGVPVHRVSDTASVESLRTRITQIAQALDVAPAGARLVADVDTALAQAQALPVPKARGLVMMNRTGTPQGAGDHTAAALVLRLAGLDNVLAGQPGYRALSAEGLGALAPDVIIVTRTSVDAMGGLAAVQALPGMALTPAGQTGCVIVMDDLLALGTGPRLPQAVRDLRQAPCVARHAGHS